MAVAKVIKKNYTNKTSGFSLAHSKVKIQIYKIDFNLLRKTKFGSFISYKKDHTH